MSGNVGACRDGFCAFCGKWSVQRGVKSVAYLVFFAVNAVDQPNRHLCSLLNRNLLRLCGRRRGRRWWRLGWWRVLRSGLGRFGTVGHRVVGGRVVVRRGLVNGISVSGIGMIGPWRCRVLLFWLVLCRVERDGFCFSSLQPRLSWRD